jgi:hypothetical protein
MHNNPAISSLISRRSKNTSNNHQLNQLINKVNPANQNINLKHQVGIVRIVAQKIWVQPCIAPLAVKEYLRLNIDFHYNHVNIDDYLTLRL